MSWDSTVLAVFGEDLAPSDFVPDVFGDTGSKITFEDATSAGLAVNLAATRYNGWVLIFDSYHRLHGDRRWLAEISAKHEVQVFRISDQPMISRWKKGKCEYESEDVGKMREDLIRFGYGEVATDPETVSHALFNIATNIRFPFQAEFSLFALD